MDEDLALHEVRQFVARIMAMDAMWDARKEDSDAMLGKAFKGPEALPQHPGLR